MADATRFLAKADEELKKRNYDYAIQMYQEAMLVDPANADARRNFRLALVRKYDDKGYPSTFFGGIGATIARSKDPSKMLAETEKVIVKNPKNMKYNNRVAQVLIDLKHFPAAVAVLEFVYKFCNGKDDGSALKMFAGACIKTGDVTRAGKLLARAEKVAPNDKEIKTLRKNLAAQTMLDKHGSVRSSIDLVKDKDQARKLELRLKSHLTAEEADVLIAEVERVLSSNPLDRRAIRDLGELYAKKKEFRKAHERMVQFVEVDPTALEIGDLAGDYMNRYYEHMIKICRAKAQQDPAKAAAYKAKEGEFTAQRKVFQLKEYGRQVDSAPTDLDKRFKLGVALFNAGRGKDAFKHLQKAHKSPKFAKHTGLYMGRCLIEMGRLEMAEQQFVNLESELTDEDDELSKQLMYFSADLMEKRGHKEAALDRFRTLFLEDAEFMNVEERIDALSVV